MKYHSLIILYSSLITKKSYLSKTCLYRVLSRNQLVRKFSISISRQWNESEEFEFEDTSINIHEIAGDDVDKIHTVSVIAAEIDFLRHTGACVPANLRQKDWDEILSLQTKPERIRFYKHLFIKEKKYLNDKLQAITRAKNLEEVRKNRLPKRTLNLTNSPIEYGLIYNTLFLRIRNQKIKRNCNYRLLKAEMFGPSLIIDCSYESKMNKVELHHCASQLIYGNTSNREMDNPFNIIHCNFNINGVLMQKLMHIIPNINKQNSLFNYTEKTYLDLYPSDKLIYLSPHSEHLMEEYEPDSIYIVGAFVDELIHEPVSIAKAQRDGIRTAKFPIEKYVNWCQGSQLLPINQCINILNDLKNNCSWEVAFKRIAARKMMCSFPIYKGVYNTKPRTEFIEEYYSKKMDFFV